MEGSDPVVSGPGQPVRGDLGPRLLDRDEVPGPDPRLIQRRGSPARRASAAGRPPGPPAAGSARRAAGRSRRRCPRHARRTSSSSARASSTSPRGRVCWPTSRSMNDGGAFASPGRQRRGAGRGGAEPGLQPDQAFPADPGPARVRAVTGLRHQPSHQPERHAVPGLARPQQVQDRRRPPSRSARRPTRARRR